MLDFMVNHSRAGRRPESPTWAPGGFNLFYFCFSWNHQSFNFSATIFVKPPKIKKKINETRSQKKKNSGFLLKLGTKKREPGFLVKTGLKLSTVSAQIDKIGYYRVKEKKFLESQIFRNPFFQGIWMVKPDCFLENSRLCSVYQIVYIRVFVCSQFWHTRTLCTQ